MVQIIVLWLILRLITSSGAILANSLNPAIALEYNVPLLPATHPFREWLTQNLVNLWQHWDANWYLEIVTQGYQKSTGTLQFHPLYPLLARLLAAFNLSPLLSLLLVSTLSSLFFMICYYHLACLDLPQAESFQSLFLLSFFPLSFILFAPYSESLFLLCSVICFYAMRRNRWWLAGLAGCLASLTRQQGLLLILPLAWEIWQIHRPNWRELFSPQPAWIAPSLTAGGYLAWISYRSLAFREAVTQSSTFQGWIYSFFISPSANQVVPSQAFLPPWQVLWIALQKDFSPTRCRYDHKLLACCLVLLALGLAWKSLNGSYRVYSLAITLISFSYYTGLVHPTMGLPRHLFLAFPVFIGLASRLRKAWMRLVWASLGLLVMFVLIVAYSLEAWVP